MDKLLLECIKYFKGNRGFNRAFEKIREKYLSLGKLGGSIKLNELSELEKEALTGFLRRNCYSDSVTISIKSVIAALEHTRFAELEFVDILEGYFGEKMISKKAQQEHADSLRESFFAEIINDYKDSRAGAWLGNTLDTKDNAYRTIMMRYESSREDLRGSLYYVCNAINSLPAWEGKTSRLAVFSSEVSKNPHTFDDGTECGKLLIHAICYVLQRPYPQNAEERLELLYAAGIIKDEISNFTVCCGINGYKNGIVHKGWLGFYESGEVLMLSLLNLSEIDKTSSPTGKVFVFENPAVFAEISERTKELRPALVCTYGQIKVASLMLLDMLYKDGCQIYYSGDFDPEGMTIANKLKERYKEKLTLWGYDDQSYLKAKSDKRLSELRLSKLDKVNDEMLKELAITIKDTRYAGYQELLIDKLIEDISEIAK